MNIEANNTLVSIIVPVYQCENSLSRTVKALLAQTYRPIEIILVDDGSSDMSGIMCDCYAEKYKEVVVYHQKHQGVSAARNLGICEAKGQYIQFTDADDEPLPLLIEKLVKTLETYKTDMAVCGYEIVEGKHIRKQNFRGLHSVLHGDCEHDLSRILKDNILSVTWNKLYRKECIRHMYDESLILCEDSVFCSRYFLNNRTVGICHEILYRYHLNKRANDIRTRRILGYPGIKKYFYYNWKLALEISDSKMRENVAQHIYKVFFYGIYTYIFEQAAKFGYGNAIAKYAINDILNDSLYQKVIRRIKHTNLKEKIYKTVSFIRSFYILSAVIYMREKIMLLF
ncbi:MAG: glycosyltransferase [Lachnospiraceae bacterium]|nr:glycosyltransferase [Lachnospiraceae bacterium]